MPELPEVETTLRGIRPHLQDRKITQVHIRQAQLRWQIPAQLNRILSGCHIEKLQRRGKYLLLSCRPLSGSSQSAGTLIIHLGMSGSLRILPQPEPPQKHDHIDWYLDDGQCLRYRDPRRFGCVLWTDSSWQDHRLLANLGVEPLDDEFNGAYLYQHAHNRSLAVKSFLMDSHQVVGVGNIYANESLFMAGIHPKRVAGKISLARYQLLAEAVKQVLSDAIEQGGTTLRDFAQSDGKPGYFQQALQVYGRAGHACNQCGQPIQQFKMNQRASYFCGHCQS